MTLQRGEVLGYDFNRMVVEGILPDCQKSSAPLTIGRLQGAMLRPFEDAAVGA